jgi:dCMP deaminase
MAQKKNIQKLPRPSWDETFMALALTLSKRVSCRHHKIASIFVDEDHRIVATGYNGPSAGDLHCHEVGCAKIDGDPKTGKLRRCRGAHSEINAIMNAGNPLRLKNSTLYVTGTPCYDCMKSLNNVGVKRIVYFNEYIRIKDGNTGHEHEFVETKDLCRRAGIKIEKFKGKLGVFKNVIEEAISENCACK